MASLLGAPLRRLWSRFSTQVGAIRLNPPPSVAGSGSKASIAMTTVIASLSLGAAPEDAQVKKHHKLTGGFTNPWQSWPPTEPQFWEIPLQLAKLFWSGEVKAPDVKLSTLAVRPPQFLQTRETEKLRATWLGHACYYVEFPGGLRVLFDPVLEERCAPSTWFGPQRFTKSPCGIADLPYVDAVVISHNHYDHMSYPTLVELKKRFPGAQFFAPLGNKKWFSESGISNMTEMDWWEDCEVQVSQDKEGREKIQGRISCLPCQHTSARGILDRAKTLWSSWSIESGGAKVYFAGDTGYRTVPKLAKEVDDHGPEHDYPHCPAFAQIGELRGPFDLGLIPIGAYEPRFIMSPMHSDPHDAVEIFKDTKCKKALAMHWGTWTLTTEEVMEPPKKLRQALKRSDIPEEGAFDICDIGESREF